VSTLLLPDSYDLGNSLPATLHVGTTLFLVAASQVSIRRGDVLVPHQNRDRAMMLLLNPNSPDLRHLFAAAENRGKDKKSGT